MTVEALAREAPPRSRAAPRPSFAFVMALLMLGLVVWGFSQTVQTNLIRPAIPRPWFLWVHAGVFSSWISLFVAQTGLVSARQVKLHRKLGVAGLCLGCLLPIVGVTTAIIMRRFDIAHEHDTLFFATVPLSGMVAFVPFFALAALNRRRPALHRRAMYLAVCVLMDAAFGRLPVIPDAWFMAGTFFVLVDGLILAHVARDLLVERRLHRIFAIGLPALALWQLATMYLWRIHPAWWVAALHRIVYFS
ncbi:MAG: hypothetical protein ACRED8_01450 [Caulobacteraceae bacterium]